MTESFVSPAEAKLGFDWLIDSLEPFTELFLDAFESSSWDLASNLPAEPDIAFDSFEKSPGFLGYIVKNIIKYLFLIHSVGDLFCLSQPLGSNTRRMMGNFLIYCDRMKVAEK